MRKKIIIISVTILVLGLVSALLILPAFAKTFAGNAIKSACPECKFDVGSIWINPFSLSVTIKNLEFETPPQDSTPVRFKIPHLMINFASQEMIEGLEISDLSIWVTEYHQKNPPPPDENQLRRIERSYGGKIFENLPPFVIENIFLNNATFHYTLKIYGKEAKLSVRDINLNVRELVTRKKLAPRKTYALLTGRVQESGKLKLEIAAELFSVDNTDKIDLFIEDLPLAEMNSFFYVEDGIKMGGMLRSAEVKMLLSQGHLTGRMQVSYKDFTMDFSPTPDHSKLETWLAEWVTKVKFAPTKPEENIPAPIAKIDYKRKPDQSFINLILQGMKDAALKAASN